MPKAAAAAANMRGSWASPRTTTTSPADDSYDAVMLDRSAFVAEHDEGEEKGEDGTYGMVHNITSSSIDDGEKELVREQVKGQVNAIARSYTSDEEKLQRHRRCGGKWWWLVAFLVVLVLTAAVVVPWLLLRNSNSNGNSSNSASSSMNGDNSNNNNGGGVKNTTTTPTNTTTNGGKTNTTKHTNTTTNATTGTTLTNTTGTTNTGGGKTNSTTTNNNATSSVTTSNPTTTPTRAPSIDSGTWFTDSPVNNNNSSGTNTGTLAPAVATIAPNNGNSTMSAPTAAPSLFNNNSIATMAPVALVGPSANDVTAFYALLQASFTDASLLGDATSYQSMAYTRMVNGVNDVYFYTVPLSETKQLQRYVLTLLDLKLNAFAANGTTDDCGWSGVTCDDEEANNATYSGTAGSAAAGGTTGVVTELNWARRGLTGTLPNELAKLSQLQVLDLGENGAALTGPIPEALYTLSASLRHLYLHGNALTGPLSDAGLASLTSLSRLFLGDNRLTGTLPQGLGSPGTGSGTVRPLTYLILFNNSFTGTIPTNWNLRDLFYLDLGHNDLTGSIPADWVDTMDDLETLYLSHNRLSGSLPDGFEQIGNNRLALLVINDNLLTGQIPGGFGLRTLDLTQFQNNAFTSMDTALCENIVFVSGEMASMRADCEVCSCQFFCAPDECY